MCDKVPTKNCECTDFPLKFQNEHCPPMCHHVSICKLRKLLDENLSADCYEQQLFYLNDFIKACRNGFYVNDLLHLTRVLEVLTERLESVPFYRPYLKNLLDICAIPPLIHSRLEDITGIYNMAEYFSVLGLLGIWLIDSKLRILVYKALLQLLRNQKETNAATSTPLMRCSAIEVSHLPEIITQLIEIVLPDEYMEVLNISLALSNISHTVCRKMVDVNALNYLLIRLLPNQNNIGENLLENLTQTDLFLEKLDITCQILLNLVRSLKNLDEKTLKKLTPPDNSFWAVRYVFRSVLLGKNCTTSRNNLMEFILLCLEVFPYIPFSECNLADDLAMLSVATELDMSKTWLKNIKFTNSDDDVCFKKMLLLSLCFIEKYQNLHFIYENCNVIPGLLKILSPEYETNWLLEELRNLIKYTLIVLYYITPRLIDNFVLNNGPVSLLIIVETFTLAPNDCNREYLDGSLKILARLSETKNDNFLDFTRAHFGVAVITLLCETLLKKQAINTSDQQNLAYSFFILQYLISDNPLPSYNEVRLIVKYFRRILKPNENDTCLNLRTVISAIDCLWESIMFDYDKIQLFIKMEGVYMLLDIIQMCPLPVQVIGLGCLVDVCEEGLCVPFLLTWRGGHDKKQVLLSLLAKIFRAECKKIGTRLNSKDVVLDTYYPLMGKAQFDEITSQDKDFNSTAALDDLFGSARPKIYALIQLLKTRYEEKVELTNEHYKIANGDLSPNDKVILHLAENFLALKLAEAWNELSQDLINSDILPVEVDSYLLSILTDKMQSWNESIKEEQENILKIEMQKEINQEIMLYDTLKKCRLMGAIDALREMKYIARTTDRMFMLAHKNRQREQIKKSLRLPPDDCEMHRTFMSKIDVTVSLFILYTATK